MTALARTLDAIGFAPDERHGPLPLMLLVPTFVTGLVDAISYLKLGHVFVANMTGNIVFLGFAAAGAAGFSIPASLLAIAAFLLGALGGGRLGASVGRHRGRHLAISTYVQIALVGAALLVAVAVPNTAAFSAMCVLIALLGLAMGLQNATARRLAVPDLTTTVLTLTLTGIAADSTLAGGPNPNPGRRIVATLTMLLGALVGAALIFHLGIASVLALALVLLIIGGVAAARISSSSESWTTGK